MPVDHPALTLAEFERRLVTATVDGAVILPDGIPDDWIGHPFEVHGLPAGRATTLSYAVRWHGERPAVIWEQTGDAVTLRSPLLDTTWSSSAAAGEHLWRR